ncbi:MAG: squalene synthase HpnC [Acetobacteraceae bacterium]|nr:squalene synthase HpnC [Acetobacteraceae bacterium]
MSSMALDTRTANVEAWSGKDRRDENFPVGSHLISRRVRPHMHAYYGFARNADDIADAPDLTAEEKIARLNVMEEVVLGRRLDGSPSAARLRRSLNETGVSPVHATDLLIAFRQDAMKQRYETFDELYNYCRYSAVPVGRYVIDLHGESHGCYRASDALCISLQLLNHLQDCGKDMRTLDRCYIPRTLMRHFSITERDLLGPAETPALRRALITVLDRVDRLNLAAEELPYMVRSRRLRAETTFICRLALRLADRLGKEDPLAKRVALSKMDGALSLMRALGALVWR